MIFLQFLVGSLEIKYYRLYYSTTKNCLNILKDCSSMFGGISWALILQITAQTVIFIWFLWTWKISGYNTTEIAKMLTLNMQYGVFL